MSRIIWRRRGAECVGRLTAAGPDRFTVRKHVDVVFFSEPRWRLHDLANDRTGYYARLADAKSAAEAMK